MLWQELGLNGLSLLNCVNPHRRIFVRRIGNREKDTVQSLFSHPWRIARSAGADHSGDSRDALIVIGVLLLKNIDPTLSPRNVDAFVVGVVIQIVHVSY